MTDPEIVSEHIRYLKDIRNYAQLTLTRHQRISTLWMEFLEEAMGLELRMARSEDILSWIDHRREQATVCDATINAELCVIRTLYDYMRRFDLIQYDPAVAIPALVCDPPREQDYLTVEECMRLLDTCDRHDLKGIRNYTILALFWSTGLRKRELHDLNCEDIDLAERHLLVRRGKGGKQRQIFLNDRVCADLCAYKDVWGWPADAPVFRSVKPDSTHADPNRRLTAGRIEEMVRKAGKAAGINKMVSPLALRHSFATHMYEAGITLEDIKEIMGHSNDTETTIYIHVTVDATRAFLNAHISNQPANRRDK